MKLNLGSGQNPITEDGWCNIDREPAANPDLVMDLDKVKFWPFQAGTVSEIAASHVLEHIHDLKTLFQEAYRVMMPDALMYVKVPHPRSDEFLGDVTHVHPITGPFLSALSRKTCEEYKKEGYANTPLATYWNVDFELLSVHTILKEPYKGIPEAQMLRVLDTFNNVASECHYVLRRV